MSTLFIEGGHELSGEITIPGSKNATTPILAATLLTKEECIIHNVPDISDVAKMVDILKGLGASVVRDGKTIIVKAEQVSLKTIDQKLVRAMRSSILLFGPLLARLGEVTLSEPGGCVIGRRPLDAHIQGLQQLGVVVSLTGDAYHLRVDNNLQGAHVVLPEFSVTATENVLMAAVLAHGTTIIELAAAEPHVQDLCRFLISMGAKIFGIGSHRLIIEGVPKLHGATHTLIPDGSEVGTWAILGALTRGEIVIHSIDPEHLDIVLYKMKSIGVGFECSGDTLRVRGKLPLKSFKLQAMPYPGFPTELQAAFSLLATQANGTSLIHDPLYEGRMNHIAELIKMGADAVIADPHRVIISGPTPLYGREIRSFDLRAGATLVIAGLVANGETIIHDLEIVERGYEHIVKRLKSLGAYVRID